VRFDSARAAGLGEDTADLVRDGYDSLMGDAEAAALALTDKHIGVPAALDASTQARLDRHYTRAEQVELALGVGLFLGMSKVLIVLGLEPEDMPVTVIPTPGGANSRD
jgi:alkylhydroperoxidase family enzyme